MKENRKSFQQFNTGKWSYWKQKHCFEMIHLKHVVEQVHCGAAHVDGDGVEEEDGVVLGHAEHHFMVR